MVNSRRSFIVSLAALLGPRAADAQRSGKAPRVGTLCPHRLTGSRGMPRDVFEHALGDRGWTPGSTVVLEYRDTNKESDALAEAAAGLARLNVDLIVTWRPGHSRRSAIDEGDSDRDGCDQRSEPVGLLLRHAAARSPRQCHRSRLADHGGRSERPRAAQPRRTRLRPYRHLVGYLHVLALRKTQVRRRCGAPPGHSGSAGQHPEPE